MHPRTVGRPPRRMPVCPRLAFHSDALREQRPHRAFTLIELLVVIGIIGILVGLTVPSLFGIYERARKTQAKNDLTQIITAVNAFYTDYGKYPTNATNNVIYGPAGTPNNQLFTELRACPGVTTDCPAAALLNTRKIVFISPRDGGHSGIWVQPPVTINGIPIAVGDFVDPWGIPYNLEINAAYNNQITNPYSGGAGVNPILQGVIGWSLGKDRQLGTKGDGIYTENGDDVISWQ
jgi:prepilin-type N-terminal cleavage/methylation domain-containing protein